MRDRDTWTSDLAVLDPRKMRNQNAYLSFVHSFRRYILRYLHLSYDMPSLDPFVSSALLFLLLYRFLLLRRAARHNIFFLIRALLIEPRKLFLFTAYRTRSRDFEEFYGNAACRMPSPFCNSLSFWVAGFVDLLAAVL